MAKFSEFALSPRLVAALAEVGYVDCSPIQARAIPQLLRGQGGIYKAPTGSGKTLAYLAPILERCPDDGRTHAVIIVPTKVLVAQIGAVLKKLRRAYPAFNLAALADGSEIDGVNANAEILVTTPGLFLAARGRFNCKDLAYLIFDEGDMLIYGGFEEETAEIMSLPLGGVKALFTASVDEHLESLVRRFLKAGRVTDVTGGSVTAAAVSHVFVDIRHLDKGAALLEFLRVVRPYKAIAFVSNKKDLQAVDDLLSARKIPHACLHGDLPKREQKKALKDFASDRVGLLLASDIAARGYDMPDVTDVISLDLPLDMSYYFHRAGRTGRYDAAGTSYVFYSAADTAKPRELLKKAGPVFRFVTLRPDGLKPDRDLRSLAKREKMTNVYLEKEIKKAVAEARSGRVKPGYKKRVARAVARVKERHKEQIIRTNVRRKKAKDER